MKPITKELLEKALASHQADHSIGKKCDRCEELGRAMYDSAVWFAVETLWFLVIAESHKEGPEQYKQAVRMAIKEGINIGMEIERQRAL